MFILSFCRAVPEGNHIMNNAKILNKIMSANIRWKIIEYHNFIFPNEMMNLDNNYQWLRKSFYEKLMGNFTLKHTDQP